MSSFAPPPVPTPNDSEPGPPPSLPEHTALWNDVDMHGMRGASAPFSEPHDDKPDDPPGNGPARTIGHIGRYALKHQLGEGGIGTVFAAHDPLLSRLIAVKTLHVEVIEAERESFNALFLNEARAAAGLNHPNIVTVFDAGISDDRAYIAMELLKGRDLRQLRQEGWRATPAQAALIVRRVADALGYAHSKGVVHRDVKPANIFMIGRTQPKVLDFGIARIAHQHEAQQTGEIAAGSPYYMAPEQARQEPMDRRADVFSLGVVLYELLTDLKPFRGNTLAEITAAVLEHEPPLANVIDATVPAALAQITAKALAKNPEQRYRSARAFSRELRHWLDENTVSFDGDVRAGAARRAAPLWLAVGAGGAVVLGAMAWATLGSHKASTPSPASELAAVSATLAGPVAPIAAPAVPPLASASAAPDNAMAVAPDTVSAALAPPKPAVASKPPPSSRNAVRDALSKGARSREARERAARSAAMAAAAAQVPTAVLRVAI
ncbi:MAG: serine/threonine-protein kinase, partial [Pseudomonadota bacterium]